MGIGGAGVGAHLEIPTHINYDEQQKTAAPNLAKAALGMVPSGDATLSLPMISVNGDDARKYKSGADRPVLAPLVTTRMGLAQTTDESEQVAYNKLVSYLPDDFRSTFQEAIQRPKGQQITEYNVLNNNMQSTATTMAFLDKAGATIPPDGLTANLASINQTMPYRAAATILSQGNAFSSQVQNYLETVGPNHPNFDAISGYVNALNPSLNQIQSGMQLLQQDPPNPKAARALFSDAANQLTSLSSQFDSRYSGNDMLMLGAFTRTAATTAQALSLEQSGSGSLLFSLALAMLGIKSSDSSLGALGDGIGTITDAVSSAITTANGNQMSAGGVALLSKLVPAAYLGAMLMGTLTNEPSDPSLSDKEQSPKETAAKNLSYDIAIQILKDSNLLSGISNQLISASEIKGESASQATTLVETMMHLGLVAAASSKHNFASAAPLLNHHGPALEAGITQAASYVDSNDLSSSFSEEGTQNFKVHAQIASIVLKEGNTDGFFDAAGQALEQAGVKTDQFIQDINEMKTLAYNFQAGISHGSQKATDRPTNVNFAA